MEILILGAGPAYTDRRGAAGASYLISLATAESSASLLLDLGHGAFINLANAIEPGRLDAIAISHLHPDHFVDLVPLRHYLRYQLDPPGHVRVLGPADLAARIDGLLGEPAFAAQALDIENLTPGVRTVGPFRLEARLVTHTEESYAFRVSPGAADQPSLVYSGDCGRADDLLQLIRPGDTLLAEVAFGPGPVPSGAQHLDGPAVGRLAARSGVASLMLTHLQMGFDPAETLASATSHYSGEARLVMEGERFAI